MEYIIKNRKVLVCLIIISFSFIAGKWINSFLLFPDEHIINKIIFEITDSQYFPLIHNLANLNFNPGYSSLNENLKFIPIPYSALIFHAVVGEIFGYFGFIFLEFLYVAIFLYIFFLIFRKLNFTNMTAILLSSFVFTLPPITSLIDILNIPWLVDLDLHHHMLLDFYGDRIPRPAISNLYFFLFLYLLINFYKEKMQGNFFGIFIGILLSAMWVSFYYHFSCASITLMIVFFLKYREQLFNNLKKKSGLIIKIIISFLIASIPLIILLYLSEPDYAVRVGLIELDLNKKTILLNHLFKNLFTKELLLVIILNSLALWYIKKKQNLYCSKSIEVIFVLFLSSIISPFLFIAISPIGVEMYHFLNLVIVTGLMCFFISCIVLVSIFLKKKIIKNNKILFLRSDNFKFLLVIIMILFYNYVNLYSTVHITLKSKNFFAYRSNFNDITSKLENNNVNLSKESNILTFNDMFQTWWILSDYKYLSVVNGAFSPRKTHDIENQVIDSFKFLKLNVDDFLRFFENKKDGWRYFNKNTASVMHMTYTANSLKTFSNSKNFEKDILNFIQNTSPFYSQQMVIPKDEFKRLKKKFLQRDTSSFVEPDLIIIKKDNEISEKMIIELNEYCKLKNDFFFAYVKYDKIKKCE